MYVGHRKWDHSKKAFYLEVIDKTFQNFLMMKGIKLMSNHVDDSNAKSC